MGSSPSDGVGVGSERWTWVEVQVSSAHSTHLNYRSRTRGRVGNFKHAASSETHENGWNCLGLVLHLLICLLISFRALYTVVAPSRHLVNVDELVSKSGVNLDISHITVT